MPTVAHSASGIRVARRPLNIPSLDGLRAVSFLIVFVAHAGLKSVVPGGFGVTVFFFLSGYLITTLTRIEAQDTGRVSQRNFYVRRALRIFPPFYIVLAGATLLVFLGVLDSQSPLRLMPVLSQYLHFSNFWIASHGMDGMPSGTNVYWSLAVEEHFYLLFPIAFVALARLGLTGRTKATLLWGLCAAVLVWRCVLVLVLHAAPDRTYLCSDTRVDSIAFGCALALWRNPVLDAEGDAAQSAFWRRVLFPAGMALLLVTFLVRGPVFRETLRYTLQGIALTPVFVAAVRWPRLLLFRPLNWRPVRFIGTLSYSLYLVHFVTLSVIEQHSRLGPVQRGILALLVSVGVSWAIYRVVERPCARLRKHFSASA
jgi:peptidoglycan/LPS O-acetylase OafA/YrhL